MNIFKYIFVVSILSLMIGQVAYAQTTGNFEVTQKVRNLTKQDVSWADSLQADPGDRIEFQITVIWRDSQATQNVLVRETLAEKLAYGNNLKIDGTLVLGDITKESINIGTLGNGQSKQITFEAQAAVAESFLAGTSNLINTVTVFNAEKGVSTTSAVQVTKAASPTDVSTGPLSVWMIWSVLLSVIVLCGGAFLFFRSYVRRQVLESPYATRTDRKLATMIVGIKEKERKP
ncbi:MAG TPA: hypothetical protein VJC15_02285 [Candidatus Paceibacterota bacterium]